MAIENVVIAYTSDISDVISGVKQIEIANRDLAKQIGIDLSQGFKVVNDELKKIKLDKTFNIQSGEGLKKVEGDILTFEKTIQTADGQLAKFTRTIGVHEGGMEVLGETVTKVTQKHNDLLGQSSKLATNFSNLTTVNRNFGTELSKFGDVTKFVGTSLNQVSDEGIKVAKIFETANGKFVKLTETTKLLPSGIQEVTRTTQEMSRSQVENATTLENASKRTVSFTENIIRLGKRALLTIPIWFALRTAITAPLKVLRDGLKDLAEFDRALQLLGKTLKVPAKDFASTLAPIQEQITRFSLESGQSVEKITIAIQKFATVGFDLETSLAGGISATKTAVLLFGDAEETARAFARALRILVDTSKPVVQQQKEIAESLSLMEILWDKNEFEISDANEALTKFAPIAKVAGLSMRETLTLLATLGTASVSGGRAGTLLNTTIQKLIQNLDEVAKEFNININPATDTTFTTLVKVVDASAKLGTSFEGVIARSKILTEVFGGVRGSVPIQSLSALNDVLHENIALSPDLEGTEKRFQEQTETLNKLVERHKNLNREMKKAFVTGLLGAGNYQKALELIVNTQIKLINDTQIFGAVVRNAFISAGVGSVIAFRKELLGLIPFLATKFPGLIAGLGLGSLIFAGLSVNELIADLNNQAKSAQTKFEEFGSDIADQIQKGLNKQLNFDELDKLVATLEVFGADQLSIDTTTFEKLLVSLKAIRTEEQALSAEKQKQLAIDQKKEVTRKQEEDIVKELIKHELALLQLKGATASQLIEAEQSLNKQFGIQQEIIDVVTQELEKQRALNEERELGNSISDRSQKLADIARENGVRTAENISKVLSKQKDLNTFLRQGGKDVEIFKKVFGDVLKQEQDLAFLRGERVPGEKGLRGGDRIVAPLSDQALITGNKGLEKQAELDKRNTDKFITNLQKIKEPFDANTLATVNQTTATNKLTSIIEQLQSGELRKLVPNLDVETEMSLAKLSLLSQQSQAIGHQQISVDFNINGKDLSLTGSPEQIKTMINQIKPGLLEVFGQQIDKIMEDKIDEVLGDGTVVK